MHTPTNEHMSSVKRMLRFLKGTIQFGLHLLPGPLRLIAYCDADWAGDPEDHHSTNGYYVYFGQNSISWSS